MDLFYFVWYINQTSDIFNNFKAYRPESGSKNYHYKYSLFFVSLLYMLNEAHACPERKMCYYFWCVDMCCLMPFLDLKPLLLVSMQKEYQECYSTFFRLHTYCMGMRHPQCGFQYGDLYLVCPSTFFHTQCISICNLPQLPSPSLSLFDQKRLPCWHSLQVFHGQWIQVHGYFL